MRAPRRVTLVRGGDKGATALRTINISRIAALGGLLILAACSSGPNVYRVCVPRADLTGNGLETQLLYGERVILHEQDGELWRVEAIDQPEFNHNDRWEGYPGYVKPEALMPAVGEWAPSAVVMSRRANVHATRSRESDVLVSLWFGTRLESTWSEVRGWVPVRLVDGREGWMDFRDLRLAGSAANELRRQILDDARKFIGRPYLWGGRSPEAADCSGLVNLAYRAGGVDLPRDAHEQYMRSEKISAHELKPGDLIFTARVRNPDRISHVMLYAGDGKVIEAVRPAIRETTVVRSLGTPLDQVVPDEPVRGRFISFGRILR